jgi:ribonuclease HII
MVSNIVNPIVIGLDEVGRGPGAGPVTVASIGLPVSFPLSTFHTEQENKDVWNSMYSEFQFVRDSKHLSEAKRKQAAILGKQFEHYIISLDAESIDRFGMGVCISHLFLIHIHIYTSKQIEHIYFDGKIKLDHAFSIDCIHAIIEQNPHINFPLIKQFEQSLINKISCHVRGDDSFLSIALASNLAKVERDEYMIKLHHDQPHYYWNTNKGYLTEQHRNAIRRYGITQFHRKTFLKNIWDTTKYFSNDI